MKVFLVIPTLEAGGAERVMSILANSWVKKNAREVEIILLAGGIPFYEIDKRVKITNLGLKVNEKPFFKIIAVLKLIFLFRGYVKKNRPDFVLCFMTKYNIFTILSLFKLKIKTIISEREGSTEKVPKIRSFLRDHTYRFADGIICQTELAKEFIVHKTKSANVISIVNPIEVVESNNPFDREKIILNVGRLVEKKGQKYLIEAFANLKYEGWKLVFLGDGPLKDELIQQVGNLGIKDDVLFNGTTLDVNSWYRKSAVFAFPSTLEGYPNALAEAMCNGLACVSFDCKTGPNEIIVNDYNGFLIEERNVGQLIERLQQLIDSETLRIKFSKEAFKLNKILDENIISEKYYNFCVSSL